MKDSGVAVIERDAVMSNPLIDAESSIPGFAIQQHYTELTQFLIHRSAPLRLAALGLIGTLLRQGMLSPLDVIAPLIAMQGDGDGRIREEALVTLQVIDERHPTFLGNRMVDGVEQCYAFQTAALGHTFTVLPEDTHDAGPESVFKGLYWTCVQAPKRRRELLDGIVARAYGLVGRLREQAGQCAGSYEVVLQEQALVKAEQDLLLQQQQQEVEQQQTDATPDNISVRRVLARTPSLPRIPTTKPADPKLLTQLLTEGYDKPALGAFLASALAYLPYDTADEPMQVVYYINRNVTVGTSLLLTRLKAQFLAMGGEMRRVGAMQPPALGSRPKGSKVTPKGSSSASAGSEHGTADGETELVLNDTMFGEWLEQYAVESSGNDKSASVAAVRVAELLLLALQLRCNEAILRLKTFLKAAYALSDDRCAAYSPDCLNGSTPSSVGGDRLSMYSTSPFTALPVEVADLHTVLSPQQAVIAASDASAAAAQSALASLLRIVAADFNRVAHLLNDEATDFTLVAGSSSGVGSKRKRRSATGSVAAGSAPGSPAKPPAAKRGTPCIDWLLMQCSPPYHVNFTNNFSTADSTCIEVLFPSLLTYYLYI
jgi:hypothetical protein